MKKKTVILILLALLLVAAGVAAFRLVNSRTSNTEPVRINLTEGDFYELCDQLDENNVNASTVFHLMAHVRGLDKQVRPGSYLVQPHMSLLALVQKLYRGQQDPIRLTIGKFRTPQQLNEYLKQKLMHSDFNVPLDSFYIIRPDTYEFYWTVTPEKFMERMVKEYDKFGLTHSPSPTGEGSKMTRRERADKLCEHYQLLPSPTGEGSEVRLIIILASIVEEETNYNPEKPLIASVYLNRLKRGMPLQADPTVKYAVGDFTLQRILNKHLAVESPFNTYLHTGLPSAPICLPSAASVDAVLNAPETDYLYFCASDRMDGTHCFAATLTEHNRNATAFHKALDRLHIR